MQAHYSRSLISGPMGSQSFKKLHLHIRFELDTVDIAHLHTHTVAL